MASLLVIVAVSMILAHEGAHMLVNRILGGQFRGVAIGVELNVTGLSPAAVAAILAPCTDVWWIILLLVMAQWGANVLPWSFFLTTGPGCGISGMPNNASSSIPRKRKVGGCLMCEWPCREMTFYTISEVAQILRCSPQTVHAMIHTQRLPAIIIGKNRCQIPQQALRDFLHPEKEGKSRGKKVGDQPGHPEHTLMPVKTPRYHSSACREHLCSLWRLAHRPTAAGGWVPSGV